MLILYLPQLFVQSDFNVTITPQNMQVIIRKTGERIIALANYAEVFRYTRRKAFLIHLKYSLFFSKKRIIIQFIIISFVSLVPQNHSFNEYTCRSIPL